MNLSFLEQDIIELLIFQPRCACEIAEELNRQTWDVEAALNTLKDRDLVRGEECGDFNGVCTSSAWEYCGGRIGEFFNYTLTKGIEDGRRIQV